MMAYNNWPDKTQDSCKEKQHYFVVEFALSCVIEQKNKKPDTEQGLSIQTKSVTDVQMHW